MASTYNMRHICSMFVSLKVYHKYKVGRALVCMQHRHISCREFHICHDLVLYQNVNDNSFSSPLFHEALDVDHKILILVIGLYHNTFSLLCVQHRHCTEHDTLCLSIFFYWVCFCPLPNQ